MNVTRQPLLIALPTLLLVLVAVLVRKQGISFVPELVSGVSSLPAQWITSFQMRFPHISWVIWLLCHTVAALTLGRMGLRHNLYGSNTLLPLPLYGFVACGIFVADHFLVGALSGLLLARAMRNLSAACRNGYAFDSIFRGALYLGIIPLLLPASFPLFLLLPLVIFLFKRTFRECVVSLVGLLLPLGALCYLHWAFTGLFGQPLLQVVEAFRSAAALQLFGDASPLLIAQLVLVLAATLCALFYYLSDIYAATSKARAILTAHVWLFFLTISTLLMPGASANGFVLAGVPIALLLPFLFVRLKRSLANLLYLSLGLLTLLRLFL